MNVTQRHISWGRGTGCPQGFLTMKKKPKGEERRKNWEERKLGKRKGNLGRKEKKEGKKKEESRRNRIVS